MPDYTNKLFEDEKYVKQTMRIRDFREKQREYLEQVSLKPGSGKLYDNNKQKVTKPQQVFSDRKQVTQKIKSYMKVNH